MADIDVINVGGTDYNVKDATARTDSDAAVTLLAYKETGNTASQAYSVIGTPINWKGTLYYTKTAVAKNATWAVGTNLVAATNLGKLMSNIKTYINGNGELVFRDLTGADTVLPFSGSVELVNPASIQQDIVYYYNKATTINLSGYSSAVIAIHLTSQYTALLAVDLQTSTYLIKRNDATNTDYMPTVSVSNHVITLTPPSGTNSNYDCVIFAYT